MYWHALSLTDGSEPAVPSVPTQGYFTPTQRACPSHFRDDAMCIHLHYTLLPKHHTDRWEEVVPRAKNRGTGTYQHNGREQAMTKSEEYL